MLAFNALYAVDITSRPLFCQDEARVHKVTKRVHTLEEVGINVRLLTEMLSHYNKDSSTESDREIIKVCALKISHAFSSIYQLM